MSGNRKSALCFFLEKEDIKVLSAIKVIIIETMIPKTIHYCWFGGKPLPEEVKEYMATWKQNFPCFKIKQWDESNFDVNALKYTRQAYFAKKYAFVSDVARLHALATEGGLYFDTDIIVKKPFPDEWFNLSGFGSFEHDSYIQTGILATEAGNKFIKDFLDKYKELSFFKGLKYDLTTNVNRFTKFMRLHGFIMNNKQQTIDDFCLFPQQLLCGKDWLDGRYDDESTYAVHDYAGTWGKEVLSHRVKHICHSALTVLKWHIIK